MATPTAAEESRGRAREWATVYLKGACMGAADAVPGVSGGTIALITGIYERLIDAVTALDPGVLALVPELGRAEGRRRLRERLVEMDVLFLIVLVSGVFTSLLTVTRLLDVALADYRAYTFAFFFGLIAASALVLYGEVHVDTLPRVGAGLAGFVLAFVVSDRALAGALPTTLPVTFVAGAIAISAMVLPGVSGAFLLLVLGQYEFVSGIPRAVLSGVLEAIDGNTAPLLDALAPFAAFMAGALVGVFSVAYAVRAALRRYREATLTFLVSLMVGALRLPATEVAVNIGELAPRSVVSVFVPAVVGIVAVLLLDRHTDDLEY